MGGTVSDSRPRSGLSRLRPEQRDALIEYGREHSIEETARWLATGGLGGAAAAGNVAELCAFLEGSELGAEFDRHAAIIDRTLAAARRAHPDCPSDEIHEAGQNFFSGFALLRTDPRAWESNQRLMLRRDQMRLDLAKFKHHQLDAFQAGLDAIAERFKGNPEASALYLRAVDRLGWRSSPSEAPPACRTGDAQPPPGGDSGKISG